MAGHHAPMSDDLARAEALFRPSKPVPSRGLQSEENAQGQRRRRIVRLEDSVSEPAVKAPAPTPQASLQGAAKLLELPARSARRSPPARSRQDPAPRRVPSQPAARFFKVLVELGGEAEPRAYVVEAPDLQRALSRAERLLDERLGAGPKPGGWTLRSICKLPELPA